MEFKKAVRQQAKLRLALSGPSGSGKTYGALKIAKGLGGRIAVIDTERGSASLYSHLVDFDTLELNAPYKPECFIEALRAAEKAGYDIIIIDSITHEWNGSGGCLEANDKLAAAKYKGNTWAAWNETTPRHRAFVDYILQSSAHIIATVRAKTDTVQEGGRVKKLGMKDEQRDGNEYEFTTVLNLIHDGHHATAAKDRTELFREPHVISEETGRRLKQWLNSGLPMKSAETPKLPTAGPESDFYANQLQMIRGCHTLEELRVCWNIVNKELGNFNADQISVLTVEKNRRKSAIEQPEDPADIGNDR